MQKDPWLNNATKQDRPTSTMQLSRTVPLLLAAACNPPHPATSTHAPPRPPVDDSSPRFVQAAAAGEVPQLVTAARAEADRAGRVLVVYVGATWCEPCQYFHRAADAHALDRIFPRVTFLEFDLDRDADRLAAAGYASEMIPLFVRPDTTGRGSARRIAGSVHGPGAVDEITPRLRAILAD